MKRTHLLLAVLAVLLVLSSGIGAATAYFTTYTTTVGGHTLALGGGAVNTDMYERFSQWTKHVFVENEENSVPAYVRVRAFSGSIYELDYSGGDWVDGGDGWWYYTGILEPGTDTGTIDMHIGNVPEDVTSGDDFNIVVVYETTPVQYDESGVPYADWNVVLDGGD